MSNLIIRPITANDRIAWEALWTRYLTLSGQTVGADVKESSFNRMVQDDPREIRCLLAEMDGTPIGLAHFLIHAMVWSVTDTCFLMDLYVAEEAEGQGVARALIDAVKTTTQEHGVQDMYWHVSEDNARARALYKRIAQKRDFLYFEKQF